MKYYNKYIKKYYKLFLTAVFFLSCEAFCDLLQPSIMAKIIDVGVKEKDFNYVSNHGMIMLGIVFIGALAASARNILSNKVSQNFGKDLRLDLYKKIQGFSFDNVDDFDTASLITRLTNDVTQLQNFINGLMRIFVKAPLLCIGSIIMAARLNFKMASVLFIIVPIIIILTVINAKVGLPFFIKVQTSIDKINGVMREYLSGVRVVKAFKRFKYEENRFEESNEELQNVSTSANKITSIFSPAITMIVDFGIIAALWIGGIGVKNGSIKVGQIIAFINYMLQILTSLTMISFVFTNYVRAKVSFGRVNEIFSEVNNMESGAGIKHKFSNQEGFKGRIDFEDVYFSYKNSSEKYVLKDISFTIMPGETVAIIGSTGCGKSTLINLIPRFYDVSQGKIRVNGINVKEFDLKTLREKIAVVSQKNILFSGTILSNLIWGNQNADFEEIKTAAKMAQADEFITSFENGYDTILGRGGVNISGGQKQRITIARALLKKSQILILDDCTSAIDAICESKIKQELKKMHNKVTTIIIAERISSAMDADKIIVLDNGRIAAIGNHKELINSCQIYKDIVKSQFGKEMENYA